MPEHRSRAVDVLVAGDVDVVTQAEQVLLANGIRDRGPNKSFAERNKLADHQPSAAAGASRDIPSACPTRGTSRLCGGEQCDL